MKWNAAREIRMQKEIKQELDFQFIRVAPDKEDFEI